MKFLILIWCLFSYGWSFAQDSLQRENKLTYSGYIKDLQWARFDKGFKTAYATNLFHNRFNLKWKPSEKISGRLEIRNRFYWGDDVKTIPNMKDELRNQNEALNLSACWFSTKSTVLHSNIERAWMEYTESKWNVRTGRQRINWGMANTWNPNDLFNTYNFLDFDYEERPGSDGVKWQYLVSDLSNIELAYVATGANPITAAKYSTNYRKYDLQWIIGWYQHSFTGGFGWAGNISNVGFKGEAQFYVDNKDSLTHVNATMEVDYIFKNGWYVSSAILYNQNGLHKPLKDGANLSFQASPRNLMPSRWSWLINSSKEFTPIFRGSMNVAYLPEVNMLIFFPSFTYNLKSNFDLDLVWQSFFAKLDTFQGISHTAFLRVKWSF